MSQSGADAELIARILEEMGQNVSHNILAAAKAKGDRQVEIAKLREESLSKVKDLMSKTPGERQRLLANPIFAAAMVKSMDPETFLDPKKAKAITLEDMQNRINAVKALGMETPEEKTAREQKESEAKIKASEATIAEQKASFAVGSIPQGTKKQQALQLVASGAFPDADKAEKFVSLTEDQMVESAQRNAKAGPAYQDDLTRQYLQWAEGPEMGLPPAVAYETAKAMATGNWKDIPAAYVDPQTKKMIPILPMARQHLRIDQQNADTAKQTMLNNEQSSIVSSAQELLKNGGAADLNLDQAISDVKAMRAGKKVPFPSPSLAVHAKNDLLIQQQTMEKNAQAILDDKWGVTKLQEQVRTLGEALKMEGTFTGNLTSSQTKDLEDKYNKSIEALNAAVSARYGVKFDDYSTLHGGLKRAFGAVWNSSMTGIDAGSDFAKEMNSLMGTHEWQSATPSIEGSAIELGVAVPHPPQVHTEQQATFLHTMSQSLAGAFNNPATPLDQKVMIKKFMREKLVPALDDASKIPELITPFAPVSSHEPDLPTRLPDLPSTPFGGMD